MRLGLLSTLRRWAFSAKPHQNAVERGSKWKRMRIVFVSTVENTSKWKRWHHPHHVSGTQASRPCEAKHSIFWACAHCLPYVTHTPFSVFRALYCGRGSIDVFTMSPKMKPHENAWTRRHGQVELPCVWMSSFCKTLWKHYTVYKFNFL